MKSKDVKKEGHHRGDRHKGRGGSQHHGPKTFRRGRAIAFLEMMHCFLLYPYSLLYWFAGNLFLLLNDRESEA
ncbi:hypothetical protein AB1L06_13070 [Bacillus mojavensis]|uniref:hypothetical protein n=1 Tax=Bacillus mojavensis TaxID=72360 RepID=UPI00399F3BDB